MRPVQFSVKTAACLTAGAVLAACGSSGTSHHSGRSSSGFPITFSECGKSYTFTKAPKILVDTPQAAAVVAAA